MALGEGEQEMSTHKREDMMTGETETAEEIDLDGTTDAMLGRAAAADTAPVTMATDTTSRHPMGNHPVGVVRTAAVDMEASRAILHDRTPQVVAHIREEDRTPMINHRPTGRTRTNRVMLRSRVTEDRNPPAAMAVVDTQLNPTVDTEQTTVVMVQIIQIMARHRTALVVAVRMVPLLLMEEEAPMVASRVVPAILEPADREPGVRATHSRVMAPHQPPKALTTAAAVHGKATTTATTAAPILAVAITEAVTNTKSLQLHGTTLGA